MRRLSQPAVPRRGPLSVGVVVRGRLVALTATRQVALVVFDGVAWGVVSLPQPSQCLESASFAVACAAENREPFGFDYIEHRRMRRVAAVTDQRRMKRIPLLSN